MTNLKSRSSKKKWLAGNNNNNNNNFYDSSKGGGGKSWCFRNKKYPVMMIISCLLVALGYYHHTTTTNDNNTNEMEDAKHLKASYTSTSTTNSHQKSSSVAADVVNEEDKKKNTSKKWRFFNGDMNAYYNELEKDIKRNPKSIGDYAVHRWMGPQRSKVEHYKLVHDAFVAASTQKVPKVLDAGCGLGSGLMWMEQTEPNWNLLGHTISEDQLKFIDTKIPEHTFRVNLRSYNDLEDDETFDFIYSIEAFIHTPDAKATIQQWASHLKEGGIIAIIDDFIQTADVNKEDEEMTKFAESWLANALFTTSELEELGQQFGLTVIQDRDLKTEYRINELNYQNKKPKIEVEQNSDAINGKKTHQGWMGAQWRRHLMIDDKLTYHMLVFQKGGERGDTKKDREEDDTMIEEDTTTAAGECTAAPAKTISKDGTTDDDADSNLISAQLMSGEGKNGGKEIKCISSWYCCGKGLEYYDDLEANRTSKTGYLQLPRHLFEDYYIDAMAKYLNRFYKTYPPSPNSRGKFLDIGGTGSTQSGMKQVTSKFQHFTGPHLDYWILDADAKAKTLKRTLYCNIDNCPSALDCEFDVTFSHTVLEHSKRPWLAFDTVARITKRKGLTVHLVPFSYQYHATPEDHYRFSHTAVTTLLEDRNFTILDVGYDICDKPMDKVLHTKDEHYDRIWLTYVIAQKN